MSDPQVVAQGMTASGWAQIIAAALGAAAVVGAAAIGFLGMRFKDVRTDVKAEAAAVRKELGADLVAIKDEFKQLRTELVGLLKADSARAAEIRELRRRTERLENDFREFPRSTG